MKMYSNTISIVHSNFRRKEPLYLFIQALFLSWTDTGFRDLQFSLVLVHQKLLKHHDEALFWNQSGDYSVTIELQMRFPLPVIDWRARSFLLLRYHTGRRRIEWEVWRWISTPGTDKSMAALSQTRAAMLWSVKQKYDPSKSLIWPFAPLFHSSGYYPLITIGLYMCCNRVLPPTL